MASRILCRRAPTPAAAAAAAKLLQRVIFVPSSSSAIRSFATVESDPDRIRFYSSKDAEKLILRMKADLRALAASCDHRICMDIRVASAIVADDGNRVSIHFDMPGLSKEHVTVTVEDGNVMAIRGEDPMQTEGAKRCYTSRIELPDNFFNLDQMKMEMENGVLKVTVPKVMDDDDGGYNVKIE